MKRGILFLFMALVFATACDKDNEKISGPVTRDQAVKLCKEYIDASDVAIVFKDIIPAGTDLTGLPEGLGDVVSPSYDAWIIATIPNIALSGLTPYWMICVNVATGELDVFKDVKINTWDFEFITLKETEPTILEDPVSPLSTKSKGQKIHIVQTYNN